MESSAMQCALPLVVVPYAIVLRFSTASVANYQGKAPAGVACRKSRILTWKETPRPRVSLQSVHPCAAAPPLPTNGKCCFEHCDFRPHAMSIRGLSLRTQRSIPS